MTDFSLLVGLLGVVSRTSSKADSLVVDSAPLMGRSSRPPSTRAGYHDTCRTCFAPLGLGGDPGSFSTPLPFVGGPSFFVVLSLLLLLFLLLLLQTASWAQASSYVPKDEALQ